MLNLLDKVVTAMTNFIVVTTTITTTILVPVFLYTGIQSMIKQDMSTTVGCLISVCLLIYINKSIQGGH